MLKPNLLRVWLLKAVPGLASQPQKLHTFVDDGSLAMRVGDTLSYEYRYKLTIIVEDFSLKSEQIFVPLIAWLSENQPDLFDDGGAGLSTSIDILDNDKGDFEFSVMLSEIVIVTQTADGGWAVSYPTPPKFEQGFDLPANGARLWQLWLNQSLAVAEPDHLPIGVDPDSVFTRPEVFPPRPNPGVHPDFDTAFPFVAEGGVARQTWEFFAANWSVAPSHSGTTAEGAVYSYTLNGVTRYRLVPTTYDPADDAFYSRFSGGVLSGLIVARG